MDEEALKSLNQMAQIIYDKKGVNILALEWLEGRYFLIAEGNIENHVTAIALAILNDFSKDLVCIPNVTQKLAGRPQRKLPRLSC